MRITTRFNAGSADDDDIVSDELGMLLSANNADRRGVPAASTPHSATMLVPCEHSYVNGCPFIMPYPNQHVPALV